MQITVPEIITSIVEIFLAQPITVKPHSPSLRITARPRPEEAPVTKTTLEDILLSVLSLALSKVASTNHTGMNDMDMCLHNSPLVHNNHPTITATPLLLILQCHLTFK